MFAILHAATSPSRAGPRTKTWRQGAWRCPELRNGIMFHQPDGIPRVVVL